jgi:hypothetical protein
MTLMRIMTVMMVVSLEVLHQGSRIENIGDESPVIEHNTSFELCAYEYV